jgi:DNA-binding transcriptional MerR regulator
MSTGMRVGELSRVSNESVSTIKYYLREGLLHRGEQSAPNQAAYDESHVRRLRLIRVLTDVGGLAVADVREVLDAISDETLSLHELLGVAHHALGPARAAPGDDVERAREEVDRFVESLGWDVTPDAPARSGLAEALAALRRSGLDLGTAVFERYAKTADRLAAWEIGFIPESPRRTAVEAALVGTVVFEAALVALRRLALEHHSARRFKQPRRRATRGGRASRAKT